MVGVGDPGQQGFLGKNEELEIDKLFRAVVERQGSDLHLKVGLPPFVCALAAPCGPCSASRSTTKKWRGSSCR